ncbi:MAG TPA: formylglycine-generating enzyme family protein [Anaerolineales bacterium]|nr:formylglycine-generating enzyme family protein [Anaerolineales bacterium]
MNRLRLIFLIGAVLMALLASCAPASTPTAAPPTAVPISTPTSQPVDLAGPAMQVGSTYLYFDGALLVAVPSGPFIMGHGGSDNPVHTVTLSDFWIYSTKVTNLQYQQCVALGKCTSPDLTDDKGYNDPAQQNDPVVGVNWAQGEAYCEYANGHLPTEAQWEKTARGPNGNVYPWGDGSPADDLLNYNNDVGQTTDVINYPKGKSYYDALDMEGNVYEWVYDWYDPFYYKTGPAQDPQGPDSGVGGQRSVRAAGFKSNNDQVVTSVRSFDLATDHRKDLGFRCVVKDPTFFAPMCQWNAFAGVNLTGTPGSSSSGSTCTPPTISVNGPDCKQSSGTVTVDAGVGDSNITPGSSGGCSPNPKPGTHVAKYTCTSAGSVTVTYTCGSSQPLTQTCPAHYNLKNGVCAWDGSGTAGQACPAGTQYNQLQMCCMSTPGTGTNFSACPAGSTLQDLGGGQYACVQNGSAGSGGAATAQVGAPPTAAQCSNNGGGGSCNIAALCRPCPNGCQVDPDTCRVTFCGRS